MEVWRMNSKILPILTILLLAAGGLFAQEPAVVVEYYENNSGEMYVRTPDGAEYNVDQFGFGEVLPIGTTLITLDGDYAELRMDPTGTIIRVAENTNFRIDGLQGREGARQNTFNVAVGKFRAVVAKQDGSRYLFQGATAVCGVRGTQFIWSILPGVEEIAYVVDGVVDYTNAAGDTLTLAGGQAADALAAEFSAFTPPSDLVSDLERGMEFIRLRADEVPGYVEKAAEPLEEAEVPEGGAEGEARAGTPKWLEKMMKFLGVELGTATIYDEDEDEVETWAKVIIQPRFTLGKLKLALYLPIIYKENMLDPSTWYHPEGNDEWSFGRDQDGWDRIALDILEDLSLKIRYIQWAESRDPFFFKFGNLDNFTIGHGSIMRNYANDLNFPVERKLGLNLGLNGEKGGLELMVNDAAKPEIFGGRVHIRPFAPELKLGFGLTALADMDPERLDYGESSLLGHPMFFNLGLDLDQPVIERDTLQMILFADLASMLPYFREDPVSLPDLDTPGLAMDAIWYEGKLRNWGLDTGIFGKLLAVDYRLEFLYSHGTFKPAFYDAFYDLRSPAYVEELVSYLSDPSDPLYDTQTMGVRGELGYTMDKVFYISGGYEWNWPIDRASGEPWPADRFSIEFGLFEDLLPVYGSISLTREGLATVFINDSSMTLGRFFSKEEDPSEVRFFDENLILAGELVYPISPIMEIAVEVKSNVIGGEWYPSWSILTRLNG
jgi:hypothetical protein